MEIRCALCRRSVEEIVQEYIKEMHYNTDSLKVEITDKLAYPYRLCEECEDILRTVVPAILVEEGIIKFDEKKGEYILEKT